MYGHPILFQIQIAVVVIGGLTVSTVLTLVMILVIYELNHFKKTKKQRFEILQAQ